MKSIEKGEEISVNYRDFVKFNYGSREYRQEVLTEKFAFLCQCSECSLEGEDLQENERMRGEIRENEMEITRLTLCGALSGDCGARQKVGYKTRVCQPASQHV